MPAWLQKYEHILSIAVIIVIMFLNAVWNKMKILVLKREACDSVHFTFSSLSFSPQSRSISSVPTDGI